jgi:hypothetical protein
LRSGEQAKGDTVGDSPSHRTQLKLGALEFSAEGSEETVRSQWEALMKLLGNDQVMALVAAKSPTTASSEERQQPSGGGKEKAAEVVENNDLARERPSSVQLTAVPPEILRRVFVNDDARGLSLRILPKGKEQPADALMLLLYGFRVLRDQHDVKATDLTTAVRVSGIKVARIDRVLDKRSTLLTTGGRAKGKTYGLNNQGVTAAEGVLNAMV